MSLFLKSLLVQIAIVSRQMLVKSELRSKLPMKLLESLLTTWVLKLSKSLIMYLLVVIGPKIGTKNFSILYIGVYKADRIGLKWGQPSTPFYNFTRSMHYSRPSFHWFQMSSYLFKYPVWVNKLFINFINSFFSTGYKFQELIIFSISFLKFGLIT